MSTKTFAIGVAVVVAAGTAWAAAAGRFPSEAAVAAFVWAVAYVTPAGTPMLSMLNEPRAGDLFDYELPDTAALYLVTNEHGLAPDGYRWGPGTKVFARPRIESTRGYIDIKEIGNYFAARAAQPPRLIAAYTHPVHAALLHRGHMDLNGGGVLWQARGLTRRRGVDGRVFCGWAQTLETVPWPVLSDYTRMKFGFQAVSKVYRDKRFNDYILDWIAGKATAREATTLSDEARTRTRRTNLGEMVDGHSVAALAAHWMCFAAQKFSNPNMATREEDSRLIQTWTANAAVEACRAARMLEKDLDLGRAAELALAAC